MSSEKRVVRKKKKFGLVLEFVPVIRDLYPPEEVKEQLQEEIKRANGLTPQYLADKYTVRVSTVKRMLKEAEENDIIECVISNKRTRVYKAKA
ncbi:MAG: hypothetical protein ACTSQE_03310 [Candidatus Heimdallarchaeaceae archaeon]